MARTTAAQLELFGSGSLPLGARRERERGGVVVSLDFMRAELVLARRQFSPHHRSARARPPERERIRVELPELNDSIDDLWR